MRATNKKAFIHEEKRLFYIVLYYSDEILAVTDNLQEAFEIAEKTEDAVVTDEKDNVLY